MSAQQPVVVDDAASGSKRPPNALRRLRWVIWGIALVVGVCAGLLIALLRGQHSVPEANLPVAPAGPDASWAAGAKRAPDFRLADQAGRPVSLAAFRGRPVIVTFMDPLCHTLCPLEARVLGSAESRLPASLRVPVLSVSVNVWGDSQRQLVAAMRKWQVGGWWHWAVGKPPALARVWRDYQIAVKASPSHDVAHTEAAFVVDAHGYQRALFLYPFTAPDLARVVRRIAAGRNP